MLTPEQKAYIREEADKVTTDKRGFVRWMISILVFSSRREC